MMLLQRLGQQGQVLLAGPHHIQGMDAQRVDIVVLVGKVAHALEVRGRYGRNHDLRHTRRPCARHHRLTIRVELRRVQMAVAVDPH